MTYNELKPKLIITRPVDSANLFASFFERNLQKEQIIISPAIEIKFFSRPKILKKTTGKNVNLIYLKESDHRLSTEIDLKMITQSIDYIRQNL